MRSQTLNQTRMTDDIITLIFMSHDGHDGDCDGVSVWTHVLKVNLTSSCFKWFLSWRQKLKLQCEDQHVTWVHVIRLLSDYYLWIPCAALSDDRSKPDWQLRRGRGWVGQEVGPAGTGSVCLLKLCARTRPGHPNRKQEITVMTTPPDLWPLTSGTSNIKETNTTTHSTDPASQTEMILKCRDQKHDGKDSCKILIADTAPWCSNWGVVICLRKHRYNQHVCHEFILL